MNKKTGYDREVFRRLVEKYQNQVISVCYHFLHNQEDAEDVAQDVFIKVYQSMESFRGDAQIYTWIYRIAVTQSLDFIRLKNRQKRFGSVKQLLRLSDPDNKTEWSIISQDRDPEQELEDHEREEVLQMAIARLSENQRTAIILSKYEGFSNEEIARIMETTTSAVQSLIHRGMKNLEAILYKMVEKIL